MSRCGAARSRTCLRPGWPPTWSSAAGRRWSCFRCTGWSSPPSSCPSRSTAPVYLPFVDFQPSLDAWRYIFVDLRSDTLRPYVNTVVVALGSSTLALALGSAAPTHSPASPTSHASDDRAAAGCLVLAAGRRPGHAAGGGRGRRRRCFAVLAATVGRRFRRTLSNRHGLLVISQRILPPVAVVIPIYVLFQHLRLLDTRTALVITYAATNLPIVVWLMRDYFAKLPWELEEAAVVEGPRPPRCSARSPCRCRCPAWSRPS